MNLLLRNFGIASQLLVAAGALTFSTGSALADPTDAMCVVSWGPRHHDRDRVRECVEAGILTIDGRRFVIDMSCGVQEQIARAFDRMGYDAWCVGGSVRVLKDCEGPEVCWRNGEYTIRFRERRSTLTITPTRVFDRCDVGYGLRFHFDTHSQSYSGFAEVQVETGGVRSVALGTSLMDDRDDEDRRPADFKVSAEHGVDRVAKTRDAFPSVKNERDRRTVETDRKMVEGPKVVIRETESDRMRNVGNSKTGGSKEQGKDGTPSARVSPPAKAPDVSIGNKVGSSPVKGQPDMTKAPTKPDTKDRRDSRDGRDTRSDDRRSRW